MNHLVEKLHACRLAILYQHSLLLTASNAHLHDASQPAIQTQRYFTPQVRDSLLVPKEVLRKEVIKALRDCPNNALFMALLCKYDNESIFAGVNDRVLCDG